MRPQGRGQLATCLQLLSRTFSSTTGSVVEGAQGVIVTLPTPKRRGRPPTKVIDPPPVVTQVTSPSSLWSWVPPTAGSIVTRGREDDEVIEVIKGQLLSATEIKDALVRLGGEDVVVVHLTDKLDTISDMVIATGRSIRQIRKMAEVVVRALKARGLSQAMGATGAEGEKDDDWLLVDCHNCVVHLMLPAMRSELGLERHWGALSHEGRVAELRAEDSSSG